MDDTILSPGYLMTEMTAGHFSELIKDDEKLAE